MTTYCIFIAAGIMSVWLHHKAIIIGAYVYGIIW